MLYRGSGSAIDVSFWGPYFNLAPGYRPFGSFAARGNYASAAAALQSWGPTFTGSPASDPALFAAPVDYVEVYRDSVRGKLGGMGSNGEGERRGEMRARGTVTGRGRGASKEGRGGGGVQRGWSRKRP